jgi:hypothetical protein
MKPYPNSRVIGAFTFTPLVGVILMGVQSMFESFGIDKLDSILGGLDSILGGLMLLCVFGLIIFGIPAFVFGWIYAYLKLERTPVAFIIITLISFSGSALYCELIWDVLTLVLPTTIFTASGLATLSSWIVAWRVLPKRGELSQE